MVQSVKIIDITRSYLPIDPNAFPESYHIATREDQPEEAQKVVFYEGKNFLPTPYGYKSYFGITGLLDAPAVPARVDRLFVFQKNDFSNVIVALTEAGIYTLSGSTWTLEISLTVPSVGIFYPWTYAIIGNKLYCYRQGEDSYFVYSNEEEPVTAGEIEGALPTVIAPSTVHPANVFYSVKPTFLNMAGQMGLFKAGSRLGFWDSANSTGWSSIDDFADFRPSVSSLAGNTIFQEVTGKIVQILSSGKGFVIYSTKGIIHIGYADDATNQWVVTVLLKNSGIAYYKECCTSSTDTEQFAYTSTGLFAIKDNAGEFVVTSVTDYLRESKQPVYLSILQGRFLFLEILDDDYVTGQITYSTETVDNTPYTFSIKDALISQILDEDSDVNQDTASKLAYILKSPAIKEGEKYVPIADVSVNNTQIVKPLDEELPLLAEVQLTREELDSLNPALGEAFDATLGIYDYFVLGRTVNTPAPKRLRIDTPTATYVTTDEGIDYYECNYTTEYTDEYDRENADIITGRPVVEEGLDLSDTYTLEEYKALTAVKLVDYQKQIWEDRDEEVNNMAAYLAAYSREGFTYSAVLTQAELDIEGEFVAKVTGTTVDGFVVGEVLGINSLSSQIVDTSAITISYSWKEPVITKTNDYGSFTISRQLNANVVITPDVTLEAAEQGEFLISAPYYNSPITAGNDTDQPSLCFITATDSLYQTDAEYSVNMIQSIAEEEDSDVYQEGAYELFGYSYVDVNDNVQEIYFTDLPPIVPNDPPPLYFPPSSFVLQDGNQAPIYPSIPGALVFDTRLNKWGKMVQDYKILIDFSPVNVAESVISYSTFGIEAGVCLADNTISLFDKNPIDSYMKLGKIGYYRQGMTRADEVRVHFRDSSSGLVELQASLDGVTEDIGLKTIQDFTDAVQCIVYPSVTGRWFNIVISGTFDVKHVEFRGHLAGNR